MFIIRVFSWKSSWFLGFFVTVELQCGKFRESSKDNIKQRVENVGKLEELGEESIKMIIFKYT